LSALIIKLAKKLSNGNKLSWAAWTTFLKTALLLVSALSLSSSLLFLVVSIMI